MNKVRWGVLGLGNIGQTFCNSIQPVGNATLQAVASKSKNIDSIHTPKEIPAKYVFTNYSDLLACDQVDAIYIALPNHLHMEWILRSLEHGKHVLVEKPAVIYPDDLLKLKKDFAGKNLIFAEAFMYLHHPRIEMLLNYIEEGKIGKPLRMKSSWGFEIFRKTSPLKKLLHFYKPKPSRFRMNHGGGCILDLGCYMTSLSYIISRIFSKTEGFCFSIEDKKYTYSNEEVELDASATIKFSNGFFSEVHCSFTSNLDENTWIFGEEGKIRLKDTWSCQTNGFCRYLSCRY